MWGAAMDIGGWLRGLGLGQYETNFRDNKIDVDLLPRLTEAGLKDIGVSALGDRLAIARRHRCFGWWKGSCERLRFPFKACAAQRSRSLG
jgi:hypothetical protein